MTQFCQLALKMPFVLRLFNYSSVTLHISQINKWIGSFYVCFHVSSSWAAPSP